MIDKILALSEKTIGLVRNEFLTIEGNVDTNIYFIKSGSVRIFVSDDGEERIIRFGYDGNLIASLDSFLTGKPSKFNIQAIKKTEVRVVLKHQLQAFLEDDADHQKQWILLLQNLISQQLEREIDILTNSPKERYQRVLKRSPELFQKIPNRHIANYLRMSPETLSRLKSLDWNQDKVGLSCGNLST